MLGARTSRPLRSQAGISDIEDSRRFSRFALSADGTSAFPAIDCLFLTRPSRPSDLAQLILTHSSARPVTR